MSFDSVILGDLPSYFVNIAYNDVCPDTIPLDFKCLTKDKDGFRKTKMKLLAFYLYNCFIEIEMCSLVCNVFSFWQ